MIISRSFILVNLIAATCLWATWEYRNAANSEGSSADSAGPDVIVGAITGVSRYPSTGSIDNSFSFAIGTTSCNIGTARMDWIQNSTLHPVISQNLYRIKNGRIEMIGMSWLKHGFSVAAGSLCNSCTDPNSSYLGVGCSDPYGSGLNGSQSGVGPRSQVNALTGAFVWPKGNLPSGVNALGGRIRVANVDVDPAQNAGARYFSESMYVHPQDAASGNGLNNASYREMFVGTVSGGFTMSFGSPGTVREQPAINAWKALHSDVNLYSVDVPGDGRIIVGVRTTPNQGGGYHTEFAIENLNSHQSVRSLRVGYGSNNISNPGFRDIDYQFEPYSGTNWAPVVADNAITWSTETFAANPNANAIRWNTLYSFWCDSELPPRYLTLGMFRPGTVAEMNLNLIDSVLPQAYRVRLGSANSGQLSNLFSGDDQYLNLGPNSATQDPRVMFHFRGTCPTSSPTDFAIRLESALVGGKAENVIQTISLRNQITGYFEVVDSRQAENSEQAVEITATGDWSRFIQPGTRLVQARVEWKNTSAPSSTTYDWSVNVDQAIWLAK